MLQNQVDVLLLVYYSEQLDHIRMVKIRLDSNLQGKLVLETIVLDHFL